VRGLTSTVCGQNRRCYIQKREQRFCRSDSH
jgi:hypothetical protein